MVLSVIVGLLAHQTRRVTCNLPHGWRNLSEHVIGVVAAFPAFLLFRRKLRNGKDRSDVAWWLAFLGVGLGVAGGWLLDTGMDDLGE